MKKNLSKIYWGEKMKRGENDVSPLTIKHGTFHWPPSKMLPQGPSSLELSIGHQAWNPPMATKLGSSLTFFFLLFF
jgi:hypothetical protein